ncbi:MAG: DUF402 domain-containing protein [Lachnospiraceae bacterium]|jgi:hypothetical protein|nr:DUF402 domain-containing protein [Lachnospiraceae bacterium]
MTYPNLYRKRIIPSECVYLKDDTIISCKEDRIVTAWGALHPKKDLHHGISGYFFKEGFKISKFYKEDNSLLYWYCDIIEQEYDREKNNMIVTDLLADVIIYPDGFVKVVDINEMVDALEDQSITTTQLKTSLRNLDRLLSCIYSGEFKKYQDYIEQFETMDSF